MDTPSFAATRNGSPTTCGERPSTGPVRRTPPRPNELPSHSATRAPRTLRPIGQPAQAGAGAPVFASQHFAKMGDGQKASTSCLAQRLRYHVQLKEVSHVRDVTPQKRPA